MRMRHIALGLLSMLAPGASAGQAGSDDSDGLVFVTARFDDRAQLQAIASRFQHLIVDERAGTARTEATFGDIDALRRAGIRVEIDAAATRRLREAETGLSAALSGGSGTQAIPGYACYRTVEETYDTMARLAQERPDLARVVDIGPSWAETQRPGAGYRMKVLRIGNAATDATVPYKAAMVVFASIHAREYTPAELLTRFGEWLVEGHGVHDEATWLVDNFRFHLVLQANPDGRKKAEAGLSWRKNVDDSNGACSQTSYGIDLNRNFPYRWHATPGGSSGNACAGNYRGPAPASEPETQHLLRYVAGTRGADGVYRGGVLPDRRDGAPDRPAPRDYRGLFLDIHSYSRLVLWPWSNTSVRPPNAAALRTLGRRLAWFNGYTPKQWVYLYAADGTDTDAVYGLLGAPSYTLELGYAFFESCARFESSTLPRNLLALRYAARNLWAPYRLPSGPKTVAIGVSPAAVAAGTPVTVTATLDDGQFNQGNGAEPVQRIASAQAFLGRPPWAADAASLPMRARDGSFDASREAVAAAIPTDGLAPGRHVVFVRGKDASGATGTPQAMYFSVTDPRP